MTVSGPKANAHVGAADVTALTGINAHVDAIHVTTSKANANLRAGTADTTTSAGA